MCIRRRFERTRPLILGECEYSKRRMSRKFHVRVAGNFETSDILGSMEYSCKVPELLDALVGSEPRRLAVGMPARLRTSASLRPALELYRPRERVEIAGLART